MRLPRQLCLATVTLTLAATAAAAQTPSPQGAQVAAPESPGATVTPPAMPSASNNAEKPAAPSPAAPIAEKPAAPPPTGPVTAAPAPAAPVAEKTAAPPPNAPVTAAPAPTAPVAEEPAAPSPIAPVTAAPAPAAPVAEKLAAPSPAAPPAPAKPKVRIAALQGAYAAAYDTSVLKPFMKSTDIEVATGGAGDSLDVVAVDSDELARKCASGELRELSATRVSEAGTSANDFLDGALQRCGTASFAWSSVFVADPAKFAKRPPRTLKDVFNTRAYPGKRALPRNARAVLEAAIMADGIPASDVYARLATDDGMKRALAQISAIGNDIVWYDKPGEAIDLIRAGTATVALTTNTRAFLDSARRGPLAIVWDGQVYDVEYLAIPAAAKNAAEAERLIQFATSSERLAEVARQIPYGPMRRSAIAAARTHLVTGEAIADYLPTAPANLATAVRFDAAWWRENAARVAQAVATAWEERPRTSPAKKPAARR